MNKCRAFWGNSATMASEAALLGIPSIYIVAEISACLKELEKSGLLFHFTPGELRESFQKLDELSDPSSPTEYFQNLRISICETKIDILAFLYAFVTEFPGSAKRLNVDTDWPLDFLCRSQDPRAT